MYLNVLNIYIHFNYEYIFYLFSHLLHPTCGFPYILFSHPIPTTSPLAQIHSASSSLQKRAGIPEVSTQVTVRLGTHPHTKAVRGSPVGEKGSQKQAKQPETDPSSHY